MKSINKIQSEINEQIINSKSPHTSLKQQLLPSPFTSFNSTRIASPLPSSSSTSSMITLNQFTKVINEYNKTIKMSEWELQLFFNLCQKFKIFKIGKDLLEEYLKLQQDIFKLIEKRKNYILKLILYLNSFNNHEDSEKTEKKNEKNDENEFSQLLLKCSEYSLKSWIAICRLRQLQWTPQPILLESNQQINNNNHNITEKIFYLDEFKMNILEILNIIKEKQILLSNPKQTWIYLFILYTTSGFTEEIGSLQTFFNFNSIKLIEQYEIYSIEIHQNFLETLKEIIFEEIQSNQIRMTYFNFSDSQNNTSNINDQTLTNIAATTTTAIAPISKGTLSTTTSIDNMKSNIRYNILPILKIQYDGVDLQDWNNYEIYSKGTTIFLNYFYQYFGNNSKRDILNDPHIIHVNNLARINLNLIHYLVIV